LQVRVPHGGVKIERGFFHTLELLEIPGPFVHDLADTYADLHKGRRRAILMGDQ
jgi:hypothetical protein